MQLVNQIFFNTIKFVNPNSSNNIAAHISPTKTQSPFVKLLDEADKLDLSEPDGLSQLAANILT